MTLSRRVLVIDEDAAFRRYASRVLASMGCEVVEAVTGRGGLDALRDWTPDCVIVDQDLSDVPGSDVMKTIAASVTPHPPVIVVSANLSVRDAVRAMKSGAKDAIEKPIDADQLKRIVGEAVDDSDLAQDVASVQLDLGGELDADLLETESPAMRAVVDRVAKLASVEMPVLLVGTSDCGTAALARHAHNSGVRRDRPFIHVAVSEDAASVEAALFGADDKAGAFVDSGDGTVFIENLAALGVSGQERLFRVLTDIRDARASGKPVTCPRLIVACAGDVRTAVEAGTVNADLAHQLAPLTVVVPTLRDRRADIPRLAQTIVEKVASGLGRGQVTVGSDVLEHLSRRDWSGNVSELYSTLVRGVVLARDGRLRLEDIAGPTDATSPAAGAPATTGGWHPTPDAEGKVRRFDEYEAEIFRFALESAGGCVSRAAENLGVGRATMYRKMRSYDIDAPPVSERTIIRTGRRSKRKHAA